ncbi:MAG TPA: hypothetical protein VEF04_03135, partial [Blastocatellia bacterium]|nr:hypothetical protein [Blastocatellia bacterium]
SSRHVSLSALGDVLQLAGITNGTWSLNSLLQTALFILGSAYTYRSDIRLLWLFPLYSVLFSAVLYFGNAPYADWYWVPSKIATLIVSVLGAIFATLTITKVLARLDTQRLAVPLIGAMLAIYSGYQVISSAGSLRGYQRIETQTREAVGRWLRDNTDPSATVLTEAIGYIGYFSDRPIIDLAGLVSPKVVQIAKSTSGNGELFRGIIAQTQPEYIVLRRYEVRDNRHFHGGPIFQSSADSLYFFQSYSEVASFVPPPEWGEMRSFTIFARK